VEGDLLQILASWKENATDNRVLLKLSLACLELMVPLTWPFSKDASEMTINHHRHIPYLQYAQLRYKRAIINFDGARILHTAIRCALPSMAEALGDRSTRDEGIIKLLLYFIRNITMIAPPPNIPYEGDEAEISRSATIAAFDYQDVFHLLLTVCSTMGEDFNTQDVVVLDVLFHLIKGVNVERLFMDDEKADNSKVDELVRLRKKEAAMLREYQKDAPSRHNKFGTMVWLQRDGHKNSIISGPGALTSGAKGLAKMDSTKKFKPPHRAMKGDNGPMDFDTPVSLNIQANKHLRTFVEEFLDSGFNPFFNHIRKAIDREAERVLETHPRQFFYLVSWFLEAERVRRKGRKTTKQKQPAGPQEQDSFALVANVLNQEMFVTLNRAMDSAYENKSWQDLSAAMKCFTQILLTVQEMSESPLEEDQDIAENILSRIFYEETTHDRVANITRTYKDQGFGYLDSCTELAHNYVRILEQYSKQNVDLQVRSRRRVRRKKKVAEAAGEDVNEDIEDESDGEDEARAQRTTNERKFDFRRFAARFLSQGCVDTFVTFTSFFNDLRPVQLKRAHRYFYRVAFKQEMSVMLFRVDIIALFYKMIKGPEGLDSHSSCFREWDDLVRNLIKKCTRKIEERPELVVEMLFSKINATAHYLEYGYEKQTVTTKPRAAAELEVRPTMEWEEQIGVVVGAMLDRNESDLLQWTKSQLESAESERRSWEGANQVLSIVEKTPAAETDATPADGTTTTGVEPDGDIPVVETELPQPPMIGESLFSSENPILNFIVVQPRDSFIKVAMFKNGHLRLLMNLVGFRRDGGDDDPEAAWSIPATLTAGQLKEAHDLIKKSEFSPPVFDDGKEAGEFIKRKNVATSIKKKAAFDDDDDGIDDDDDDEELLFEPGGPTPMNKSDALKALKKGRRRRRKEGSEEGEENTLDDEQLRARADARRAAELEKNRKIRSELYVHDSDEEDDPERDRIFFEAEEKLRERSKIKIMKELLHGGAVTNALAKIKASREKPKERASSVIAAASQEEDEDMQITGNRNRKRQSSAISIDSDDEDEARSRQSSVTAKGSDVATDTPLSSPHMRSSQTKRRKVSSDDEEEPAAKNSGALPDSDDEDEDVAPVARPARPRVRSGFIVDSSDEE
jgi:replication fork protection complex subunit Tof1/Swi1